MNAYLCVMYVCVCMYVCMYVCIFMYAFIEVRLDKSNYWLSYPFNCPAAVANGLSGIKDTFLKCLFIFSWRFNVFAGKTSTGWGRHIFGLYFENCCCELITSFRCGELAPVVCPSILETSSVWMHLHTICVCAFSGPVLVCVHGCIDG